MSQPTTPKIQKNRDIPWSDTSGPYSIEHNRSIRLSSRSQNPPTSAPSSQRMFGCIEKPKYLERLLNEMKDDPPNLESEDPEVPSLASANDGTVLTQQMDLPSLDTQESFQGGIPNDWNAVRELAPADILNSIINLHRNNECLLQSSALYNSIGMETEAHKRATWFFVYQAAGSLKFLAEMITEYHKNGLKDEYYSNKKFWNRRKDKELLRSYRGEKHEVVRKMENLLFGDRPGYLYRRIMWISDFFSFF